MNISMTNETNQLDRVAIGFAQIPIFSLTILFAILYTLLIFLRPTFRQNKLNWFTANICVTSAIFCIFMFVLDVQIVTGVYGGVPCRIQSFLIYSSVCQLMYSHCVAALCRFLAVVYANKHLFRSIGFSSCSIIGGWLFAYLTALPFMFVDGFFCNIKTKNSGLSYYTMIMILAVPLILIGVANLKILLFVRRSTRHVHDGNAQNHAAHSRDIHLLKVLVGTYLIFAIGWAPAFGIQAFGDYSKISPMVDGITQMLPPIAIFLDVTLLIVTNQPVRQYLKETFLRRQIGHAIQPASGPKVR